MMRLLKQHLQVVRNNVDQKAEEHLIEEPLFIYNFIPPDFDHFSPIFKRCLQCSSLELYLLQVVCISSWLQT